MTHTYFNNMVKINADDGKDLLRTEDNYRAKEVYCPVTEEEKWVETDSPEDIYDFILSEMGV
jgi:hypothetical protein